MSTSQTGRSFLRNKFRAPALAQSALVWARLSRDFLRPLAHSVLLFLWIGAATQARLPAAVIPVLEKPAGQILAAGDQRIMILSPMGEVLWEYPTRLTHDAWMLPNRNILFADGESVTEVTAEKKVVFQYKSSEQKGGGAYACQRLAHGITLVGENSTGRILEVDPQGQALFSLQTAPYEKGAHHNMRMARKLENGNYLVCHSGARLVKEYTPKGDVVWEVKVPGPLAFAAVRTEPGTTLVSCLDQILEYDAMGKVIWEYSKQAAAGASIRNITGLQLLPNGHVAAGCYQAYQKGEGCGLFEISRDHKLVWRYSTPQGDGTMMAIQLLSAEGAPRPGPCQR